MPFSHLACPRRNQACRITHLKRQPLRRVIYLPKGPAKRLPRPGGKATSRRTVFPRKLCQRQFRMQLRQINLCLLRVQQQTDPPIPPVEKQEVKCSAPSILTAKPSAFSDTAHPRESSHSYSLQTTRNPHDTVRFSLCQCGGKRLYSTNFLHEKTA